MLVGVPTEVKPDEYRVGMRPVGAEMLLRDGHTVLIQAGAYAEHQFIHVIKDEKTVPIGGPSFVVHLAPGAGRPLNLKMQTHANQPTIKFPWY